jgi:hypothetical protein
MIDTQKLSDAIMKAADYPAALKQLSAAWGELLNTVRQLGIPLPPTDGNDTVRAGEYSLMWDIMGGRVSDVRASNAYRADEQARALIALVPALIEYLERIAQTARDATVVADALRQALADERVQAALAMRALEKSDKPNS